MRPDGLHTVDVHIRRLSGPCIPGKLFVPSAYTSLKQPSGEQKWHIKIVLDAGHTGQIAGAVCLKERKEKDDNLALIACLSAKSLKTTAWMWYILRTEDVYQTPLEKARIAKSVGR